MGLIDTHIQVLYKIVQVLAAKWDSAVQGQVVMTAGGPACSILPLGQKYRMWGIGLLPSLGTGFGGCLCGH